MSDNTIIIVGLKTKEFENCIVDEDGGVRIPENIPIAYAGYGYESPETWRYDLKSKERYCPREIKSSFKTGELEGNIFGIYVAGTWNGAIDLESIQEYIDEAKGIFRERTGQEGKVYVIGEQV